LKNQPVEYANRLAISSGFLERVLRLEIFERKIILNLWKTLSLSE